MGWLDVQGGGGGAVKSWYDVWGFKCGTGFPSPGCNFHSDGTKIIDTEDPFFTDDYHLSFGLYEYFDSFGDFSIYLGFAWLSPSGILYDDFGFALNAEREEIESGRDVIADVAAERAAVLEDVTGSLVDRYQLEADIAENIALSLDNYMVERLAHQNARGADDRRALNDLTLRMAGVKLTDIEGAVVGALAGEVAAVRKLNNKIAKNWKTTPSNSRKIIATWYEKELDAYLEEGSTLDDLEIKSEVLAATEGEARTLTEERLPFINVEGPKKTENAKANLHLEDEIDDDWI